MRSDMRSVFMTLPAAVHGAFPRILWAGRIRGERTLAMRARAITDRAWDWFGEEECGLVVLIFPNTFLFGAARGAWSCLRGPSRRGASRTATSAPTGSRGWSAAQHGLRSVAGRASTQGRARCVSAGTGCRPRGWRLGTSDGPPFRWDENRRFGRRRDSAFGQ